MIILGFVCRPGAVLKVRNVSDSPFVYHLLSENDRHLISC
jgi:hypothetical protein